MNYNLVLNARERDLDDRWQCDRHAVLRVDVPRAGKWQLGIGVTYKIFKGSPCNRKELERRPWDSHATET